MKKITRAVKKHFLIYQMFFKNCLQAQLEYRINFIFAVLTEAGFTAIYQHFALYRFWISLR